jgi:uncharacterized membrane protein
MPDPTELGQLPPPPPSPETERDISIDRLAFKRGRSNCLHTTHRGHHFLHSRKTRQFCPFLCHASIIFGCVWFLVNIVSIVWLLFQIVSAVVHALLAPIPNIGGVLIFFWAIIAAVISIVLVLLWVIGNGACLVLWVVVTIKAFTGVRWDIPYVGPIARKQVEGGAS